MNTPGENTSGKSNIKKGKNKYDISLVTYFQFLSLVFLFTGFGMFLYCTIERIPPMETQVLSSPLHWFVLGIVCFIVFFVNKYQHTHK
jgi:hypothetical protein